MISDDIIWFPPGFVTAATAGGRRASFCRITWSHLIMNHDVDSMQVYMYRGRD
eukprot:SAG22_NODE_81_length_21778_cov_38.345173_15_plen_53_part_00